MGWPPEEPALGPSSGFGVAPDLPSHFMLASELSYLATDSDLEELGRLLEINARRPAIVEASGRWRIRPSYREPARLVPGDVVALSSLHAHVVDGRPTDRGPAGPSCLSRELHVRTLLEARSCWLPAAAIEAVLTTEQPSDELIGEFRLPDHSCLVWFAQPVLIPGAGSVPDVSARGESIRTLEATTHRSPSGESSARPSARMQS